MSLAATLYTLFLVASLALGVIASRRVRGVRDFYIAGGQMPWYMLCGTFIASNVSAGLFLGGTVSPLMHHTHAKTEFAPTGKCSTS